MVVLGEGGQYLLPHDCQSLLQLLLSDILAELAVLLGRVEGVAGRGGRAAEHNICAPRRIVCGYRAYEVWVYDKEGREGGIRVSRVA